MSVKDYITNTELTHLIEEAKKKIDSSKENSLCKYLPGPHSGYMHHFTFRKLKNSDPEQLARLIKKCILDPTHPHALSPKQRAPRGSRKKHDHISLNRIDVEKVIELARKIGDREVLAKFTPKKSFESLKKELIRSIRHNQAHQDLWDAFIEAVRTI